MEMQNVGGSDVKMLRSHLIDKKDRTCMDKSAINDDDDLLVCFRGF